MSKRRTKRISGHNAIWHGIDYGPAWSEIATMSDDARRTITHVLARVHERGRRLGIWELANHLEIDPATFDAERFYHEGSLEQSPGLNAELKHSSADLLRDELGDSLAMVGVMIWPPPRRE